MEPVELAREHWEDDEDNDCRLELDTAFPDRKYSSFENFLGRRGVSVPSCSFVCVTAVFSKIDV